MPEERPTKERYYMNIAKEVSLRSTCFRVRIGCIIVRNDQIISAGYAGAPRKCKDCFEHQQCLRDILKIPHGHRYELCRSVHSEQNCIINAARAGISILGGNMFIYGDTFSEEKLIDTIPCFICKKMIINAGINNVFCSMTDGSIEKFEVGDWVKDWQEGDIIDDKIQYGMTERSKK